MAIFIVPAMRLDDAKAWLKLHKVKYSRNEAWPENWLDVEADDEQLTALRRLFWGVSDRKVKQLPRQIDTLKKERG
jgi:hypothetical protein